MKWKNADLPFSETLNASHLHRRRNHVFTQRDVGWWPLCSLLVDLEGDQQRTGSGGSKFLCTSWVCLETADVGVSINGDTLKWMVYKGTSHEYG